jgi:hypothetical protein
VRVPPSGGTRGLSRYDDDRVNSRKRRELGLISPLAALTVLSALCNFPCWRGSFWVASRDEDH